MEERILAAFFSQETEGPRRKSDAGGYPIHFTLLAATGLLSFIKTYAMRGALRVLHISLLYPSISPVVYPAVSQYDYLPTVLPAELIASPRWPSFESRQACSTSADPERR